MLSQENRTLIQQRTAVIKVQSVCLSGERPGSGAEQCLRRDKSSAPLVDSGPIAESHHNNADTNHTGDWCVSDKSSPNSRVSDDATTVDTTVSH